MSKMHLTDRMIGLFSPETALKRVHDRQLLNSYLAALPADPKTHKKRRKSTGTANQVNRGARAIYQRARDGDENNPTVISILNELTTNIVGPDGIRVEPQPLDREGNIHTEAARMISDWFAEFSLSQNIDGEFSRAETELLSCRTWLRDGEVFARYYMGLHPQLIYPGDTPFGVQPFEPDWVPHENDLENRFYEGIQRNSLGQMQSILLRKAPGSIETIQVAARFCGHLKFVQRVHQNRGISLLHGVLDLITDLEDYDQSERISAQIASRFAYYIKRDKSIAENEIERGGDMFLGMGNSFELAPGEDAGIVESNRSEAMSNPFRTAQLKAVSSGSMVNYSSVTRNYDGSYSAQRQELVDSFSRYRVLQRQFVTRWTRPQYRMALQMALLNHNVTLPKDVDPRSVLAAIYQAPVMPWIDPAKEMTGIEKGSRLGLQSLSNYQRERNIDPLATRREIAAEREAMDEAGIISTADPKHNLQSSQSKET
ncbi:MAG: hypothetical protein CENE_03807 [Candidatus Celerinatantimonas neptuna]|nr:MAG: hypothetical protein CENE_03807 [Candidatus Celerinatantimonas neptuna]